jgi:hypothetical protein
MIGLRRLRAEICELEEMVLPPVPEKEKRRVMALWKIGPNASDLCAQSSYLLRHAVPCATRSRQGRQTCPIFILCPLNVCEVG